MQNDVASQALEIVQRLEAAGALGTGGRLPALLRYLVSEEIAGRGDRLKAYAIATEVLGRGRAFDPAQDSIVRVEVARLRRALDYFYATAGAQDPLKITIPRGSYRPVVAAEVVASNGHEDDIVTEIPHARGVHRAWPLVVGLLVLAINLGVAGWYFLYPTSPSTTPQEQRRPAYAVGTPRLVLLPIATSQPEAQALAPGLRAQLAALLSQQPWLAVAVEEQFLPRGTLPAKVFSLSTVLTKEGQNYTLRALLHAEPEHRMVWNGRYVSPLLHKSATDLTGAIAGDIARDLGYPLGPVGQAVGARSGETEPEVEDRFLCMMNAHRYWRGLEPKQRADALACLTRLAARFPDFIEGRAILAMFALEDSRVPGNPAREVALSRAETLLRGAPADDRLALAARMMLNACRGNQEATRADAEALYLLAPNDPDSLAEVAAKAGLAALDWDLAIKAETRAFALAMVPHARYAHASAAKALMEGKYEQALAAISRVPQQGLEIGQTMLLAIATLADAPLRAESAADALATGYSRRTEELFARIESTCWHPSVKAAFRTALTKALEQRGPWQTNPVPGPSVPLGGISDR